MGNKDGASCIIFPVITSINHGERRIDIHKFGFFGVYDANTIDVCSDTLRTIFNVWKRREKMSHFVDDYEG